MLFHSNLYPLDVCRLTVDHSTRECEKLRSDLQEANQRASLLAQEVDENHAKQETIRRSQLKYRHFVLLLLPPLLITLRDVDDAHLQAIGTATCGSTAHGAGNGSSRTRSAGLAAATGIG